MLERLCVTLYLGRVFCRGVDIHLSSYPSLVFYLSKSKKLTPGDFWAAVEKLGFSLSIVDVPGGSLCFSTKGMAYPFAKVSPGREAACRAVFGTWGFFRTMHGKSAPLCWLHSQAGVRRGVRASGSYQEGTGNSGSYGMWNHPRGHVWNVFTEHSSLNMFPALREPSQGSN